MISRKGTKGTLLSHIDRSMARGIMKTIILSYIGHHKTYPYALLKSIRAHNSPIARFVSKSDVYNMTAVLEKEGYIRSKKDIKGGKAQKIYTITGKGKTVVKNRDLLIKRMAIEMKRMLKEEFNE